MEKSVSTPSNEKFWCFKCKNTVHVIEVDQELICSICRSTFIELLDETQEDDPRNFRHSQQTVSNIRHNQIQHQPLQNTQTINSFMISFGNNSNVNINHVNVHNNNYQSIMEHFNQTTLPMLSNIMGNPLIFNLMNDLRRIGVNTERPPAAKEVIQSLIKEVIAENDMIKFKELECAICKDDYKVGDVVSKLPCGHYHHIDCIVLWLNKQNTCPVCRFELKTDDTIYEQSRNNRSSP